VPADRRRIIQMRAMSRIAAELASDLSPIIAGIDR
jgi:hypothetical protein